MGSDSWVNAMHTDSDCLILRDSDKGTLELLWSVLCIYIHISWYC